MFAAIRKALIAALVASAGLVAVASATPVLADIPPAQASDARMMAAADAALEARDRPADTETRTSDAADPAEVEGFAAAREARARALTAGIDTPRNRPRRVRRRR